MVYNIIDRVMPMKAGRSLYAALAVIGAMVVASPLAAQQRPPAQGQGAQPELTTERVQDWTVRCTKTTPQRCEMVQSVKERESNRDILMIIIGYRENERQPRALILMPLGVLLPPGLGIQVDKAEPRGLPFRHCEPGGCLAPWNMSDSDVAALKGGTQLTVIATDQAGKQVGLPVSLKGFTAAYAKLK
ncbi:invasion associated locus B family protein [Oceanibaculum pacificum]|uniref:Invasion protein n=1 Tax=Oceanibaculum pacificum TaxID=580166 RepID=A0A154V8G4_9PROT|nr:invasion associated locus B family protein [Oceanibaculum pacificum]KZC97660.1 hypothetical protein AUP43_15000 [Oceanibaculum pacificum]